VTSTQDITLPLGAQFQRALTPEARAVWRISGVVHLPMIQASIDNGWTVTQLGHYCSLDVEGKANAGGLITARLKLAATGEATPPVKTKSLAKFVQPLDWCGDELCEERGRWRLDPDTRMRIGHCSCWTNPEAS
jgi:hypothetical protein